MKKLTLTIIWLVLILTAYAQVPYLKYFGFCCDTIGIDSNYLIVGNKKFYVDNFPVNPECDTIINNYFIFTSPCGTECREIVIFNSKTYNIKKFYFVFAINYSKQRLLIRNAHDSRYIDIYNFDGKLIKSVKVLSKPYACFFCYIDLKVNNDTVVFYFKKTGKKKIMVFK